MSTLLASLGRWSYRHGWRVVLGWLLLLALAGGGVALFSKGTDNSFSIPGTESADALAQLGRTFPEVSGTGAQLIVVAAPGESVTDAAYRTPIEAAVSSAAEVDGVLAATDPFDDTVSGLINEGETAAIMRVQFAGEVTDVPEASKQALIDIAEELREALPAGAQSALGGDLFSVTLPTLSIVELFGVLFALLVLIVTFRSLLVAGMPLGSALIGVALSMALIMLSTAVATVSSTTPLLALMLGLAVGIDYALFIVARHQDQVRAGVEPEESAARATGTAGSAVVFAGITVMIALIGLGFAGIPFLTTMGIAATAAVAIAVAVAVTMTPAFLGFAGARVAGRPKRERPKRRAKKQRAAGGENRWVKGVTRHPLITTLVVVVGLGVAAVPALDLRLALPNAGQLPAGSEARVNYDLTAEQFGAGANGPLIMMGTIVTSTDPVALMNELADEIREIPGVKEVPLATPNRTADTGIIQIVPETAPDDPATADLVRELRAQHDRLLDEYGVDLKVTGFTAVAIDISDRLAAALLPFALFVVGLSFVLLMIVFRSVLVPLTAALGYLLSVAVAFGAVAAVFEWGIFAEALHVNRVGPVISFMPIVLMGVLFGLAMDYQVFLVTRMREDYVHSSRERGGRADRATAIGAVRSGFTATARVVTAAALIMFAVFAAFVPEGDSNLKPIALGLAVGVAVDAFVVRMTLVPALMTLMGERAWWIPKTLDRILPHFDIEGDAVRREIELAEWPGDERAGLAIVGEAVMADAAAADAPAPFAATDISLPHGEALLATADDPAAARAFALVVSGRLAPASGRLKVDGHLLPERGAWVRPRVGLALLRGADAPLAELRSALARRPRLVVIDGVEQLAGIERTQASELLSEAAARAETHPFTLVVTSSDVGTASALLSAAGLAPQHELRLQPGPDAPGRHAGGDAASDTTLDELFAADANSTHDQNREVTA